MARPSKLLDEELVNRANEGLKKLGKPGLVARKLQAIIAAKKYGITKAALFYFTTKKSLIKWIKELKEESIKALEVQVGRGRKSLLNPAQEEEVNGWIEDNCNITINQVRLLIEDKMNMKLSISTTHRLMQRLRFSHISPRPRHYKKDEKLSLEFKKKSTGET
jgi:transposase